MPAGANTNTRPIRARICAQLCGKSGLVVVAITGPGHDHTAPVSTPRVLPEPDGPIINELVRAETTTG